MFQRSVSRRAEIPVPLQKLASLMLAILISLQLATPAYAGKLSSILVFTRAEGFVHPSITDGVTLLTDLAMEEGATLDVTDETDVFTPAGLAAYDVVVWVSTTGDVLDAPEQAAFEDFIRAGGGYVGIHAAADCEYGWPWYGELLGNRAWFDSHPAIQTATLLLESPDHPGAGLFDDVDTFQDEWYNFRSNPRPAVQVVQTIDEDSYDPGSGAMGDDHPIVWAHDFQGGRSFYTALGHRPATYSDIRFKEQIRGALQWAAGARIFADDFETGTTERWSVP
ncbi:MAG: ThuA domain-containing protein [Acidobacteriota bacterium]